MAKPSQSLMERALTRWCHSHNIQPQFWSLQAGVSVMITAQPLVEVVAPLALAVDKTEVVMRQQSVSVSYLSSPKGWLNFNRPFNPPTQLSSPSPPAVLLLMMHGMPPIKVPASLLISSADTLSSVPTPIP